MQSLKDLDKRGDDNIPIILLDYSGSTMAPIYDQKRIIDHFIDLMKQVAQYDNFDKAHLILFSSEAFNVGVVTIKDLDVYKLIADSKIDPASTNLIPALKIAQKIFMDIFFNNRNSSKKKKLDIDDLLESESANNTENIPAFKENKKIPIYIFTDGEVDDSEDKLLDAINDEILNPGFGIETDIRMIVLEANDKNYFTEDCSAGNILIKTIRNSKTSESLKYVFYFNRRFRTFNNRFVNMYNALLPDGYVQYDDKCFHIRFYTVFLANITQEIADLRDQLVFDDIDYDYYQDQHDIQKGNIINDTVNDMVNRLVENANDNNKKNNQILGRLEKIGYNLIKTVRDLEKAQKDNKNFNKRQVIDFFCNLIGVDEISDYLRRELIYGVDIKTFQEYRTKRGGTMNQTQFNMCTNLQKTLCGDFVSTFTSFLENDCVYDIDTLYIEHPINLGFREYKHAGVYDTTNKRLVPILPMQDDERQFNKQILRQWIRANYSKRYGIPAGSDIIHYVFLLDNLFIQCSNLPKHIKDIYNWYASVMLEKKRYNESIQEKVYLEQGNFPKPVGTKDEFTSFLPKCPNYVEMINIFGEVFNPMTVWFMMIAVLHFDISYNIIKNQHTHCPDIVHDGVLPIPYDEFMKKCETDNIKKSKKEESLGTPLGQLKERIKCVLEKFKSVDYKLIKLKIDSSKIVPNYYCYITLSDTSDTGGYMFYAHAKRNQGHNEENNGRAAANPNNQKLVCHPSYVMSHEAYNSYKEAKDNSRGNNGITCPYCSEKIDVSRMTEIEPKNEYEQRKDVILDEREKKRMYCKVEIYDNFSDSLIELNKLDFNTNYRHRIFFKEHLVLANPMDGFGVMKFETSDKQAEFNKKVPQFLLDLDWDNIVIAGGMCRSILLGQKIQDYDIFFVGLDEEGIKNRVVELINNVVTILQQENPDYRFILMYKPLNSVVEILCTKSTFDENSIKTEEEKDNISIDEKFLFIHNEIVYKLQIILKPHNDINDIFESFDMYPSCVAFDGKKTYFNEASYVAFRYMINMIDKDKSTHESYDNRIMKYYKYGFSLAIDKKQIDESLVSQMERSPKMIKIAGCIFELLERPTLMDDMETRYMMLDSFRLVGKHNNSDSSDMNKMMNSTAAKDKALYESFDGDTELDTHMIGLYNYMEKEDIRYCYLMGPTNEDELEDVLDVNQIDFLKNRRIGGFNWYDASNIVITN